MTTPCLGLHDLFDSTEVEAHRQAAAICAECPVRDWCATRIPPGSEFPSGTWAGRLYGRVRGSNRALYPGDRKDRIEREDAMFTPGEAYAAHLAYMRGDRSERVALGHRVYDRNRKRKETEGVLRVDCGECGRNRPHAGRGLCSGCYKRARRSETAA
jgi:hypothetical protein